MAIQAYDESKKRPGRSCLDRIRIAVSSQENDGWRGIDELMYLSAEDNKMTNRGEICENRANAASRAKCGAERVWYLRV